MSDSYRTTLDQFDTDASVDDGASPGGGGAVAASPTPIVDDTATDTTDEPEEDSVPLTAGASEGIIGPGYIGDVYPKDVIHFHRRGTHAWLSPTDVPTRVDVYYLDGHAPHTARERVHLRDLQSLLDRGLANVTHTDVDNPWERWAIEPMTDPPEPRPTVRIAKREPTGKLTLARERSRNMVNTFLNDPVIDHKHGDMRFWHGAFSARVSTPDPNESGNPCAVAVLDRPNASRLCEYTPTDYTQLARYASHPEVRGVADDTGDSWVDEEERSVSSLQENTASWLISRALQWAKLEGYEKVISYSGSANMNEGHIYRATDFEHAGFSDSAGDGWTNREGREQWQNSRDERDRWVATLHDTELQMKRRATNRYDRWELLDERPMAAFRGGYPDITPGVTDFELTREEAADYNHGRAQEFFEHYGEIDGADSLLDISSGVDAIFGATVDGHLTAALALSNGYSSISYTDSIRVVGYAARETKYPTQTAAWLMSRARDWSALEGYDTLSVPSTLDTVGAGAKSVGATDSSDGWTFALEMP